MATVEFKFVAAKPFTAEHPLGSGIYVRYEPGDIVPAEEWGRAASHMTVSGTIMRYAINRVGPGEEPAPAAAPAPEPEASGGEGGEDAVEPVPPADDFAPSGDDDAPGGAETGAEDDQEAEASAFPRHLGGGIYELSDGTHARGKRNALKAQSALAPPEA